MSATLIPSAKPTSSMQLQSTTSPWSPEIANLVDLDKQGVHDALLTLLTHPSIVAQGWLAREAAHLGKPGSVVATGVDAGVVSLQPDGLGKFIAVANNRSGRHGYLEAHRGGTIAVAECLRNLACTGAFPVALTHNLHFSNPDTPERSEPLKECVRGLAEAARYFNVPVVGGNLSLGSQTHEGSACAGLSVTGVGVIEKVEHAMQPYVRNAGDVLVLLGGAPTELAGSQYLRILHGKSATEEQKIDLPSERRLHGVLRTLIKAGVVLAAQDLSPGGLLVTVSEMLFAPGKTFGAKVDLHGFGATRSDVLLFGESQGRVVVSVKAERVGTVLSEAHTNGVSATLIGDVLDSDTLAVSTRKAVAQWPIAELRAAWERGLT